MGPTEASEKQIEELKDEVTGLQSTITGIEDCIDDAKNNIEQAFKGGYENLENYIERANDKLNEAKAMM